MKENKYINFQNTFITICFTFLILLIDISVAKAVDFNKPATERNGRGLAGYGGITSVVISDITIASFDAPDSGPGGGDGKVSKLVLSWQPTTLAGADSAIMAWHHWEVRYSEVNGKDGGQVTLPAGTTKPWLYPSEYNIIYNSLDDNLPKYDVGDPLLNINSTGYTPNPFAQHNATIEGAALERIRGKMVRFQVIEWYYQAGRGINELPLDCYPENIPLATNNNYPPGYPVIKTDAQGNIQKCFPQGTMGLITSNEVCPQSPAGSVFNGDITLCTNYTQTLWPQDTYCRVEYLKCSEEYPVLRPTCYKYLPPGESYTYNEQIVPAPWNVLNVPFLYVWYSSPCNGAANTWNISTSSVPLYDPTIDIITESRTISSTFNNTNSITYNGNVFVLNRPDNLSNSDTPQQVLVGVTPPIIIDNLKPNFNITVSNTNNLSGTNDISTDNLQINYHSQTNSYMADITKDIFTGEEYTIHTWETYQTDSEGNLFAGVGDPQQFNDPLNGRQGDQTILYTNYLKVDPPKDSNYGFIFIPTYFGSENKNYNFQISKTYQNLYPGSDNYTEDNEQVADLTVGPNSSANATSDTGHFKDLNEVNKAALNANISFQNKYPQLQLVAKSCNPVADSQQDNKFSLKSTENIPEQFACTFAAKNPTGGREFKLADNINITRNQPWLDLSYPGAQIIPTNQGEMNITANIDVRNSNSTGIPEEATFMINSQNIPRILDPFAIINNNGLLTDDNVEINQLIENLSKQQQAGTEFKRDGGIDLTKIISSLPPGLSCKLASNPAEICPDENSSLSWSISPNATQAYIDNVDGNKVYINPDTSSSLSVRPLTSTYYKMVITDETAGETAECGASVSLKTPAQCSASPNPTTENEFQTVLIAGKSVNIKRADLTILYDSRFLLNTPPGFGQLLAPLWKETSP